MDIGQIGGGNLLYNVRSNLKIQVIKSFKKNFNNLRKLIKQSEMLKL
jgi:hypothetical protein